jgi:hypothetical protein
LHGLLALNQLADSSLQFDDFARNGAGGSRSEQGAAQGPGEHGCTEK